jgi:uncharacterized membrane protein (UPF0182 family)
MKTVSETIYFDISDNITETIDITETINVLISVREKAVKAGMIKDSRSELFIEEMGCDCTFRFERPETENERVQRERFEAAALKRAADAEKAKEDKDRAEYERLKTKFEGVK